MSERLESVFRDQTRQWSKNRKHPSCKKDPSTKLRRLEMFVLEEWTRTSADRSRTLSSYSSWSTKDEVKGFITSDLKFHHLLSKGF